MPSSADPPTRERRRLGSRPPRPRLPQRSSARRSTRGAAPCGRVAAARAQPHSAACSRAVVAASRSTYATSARPPAPESVARSVSMAPSLAGYTTSAASTRSNGGRSAASSAAASPRGAFARRFRCRGAPRWRRRRRARVGEDDTALVARRVGGGAVDFGAARVDDFRAAPRSAAARPAMPVPQRDFENTPALAHQRGDAAQRARRPRPRARVP